jgi:hypothetical protein
MQMRSGWQSLSEWALASALVIFGVITGLSIGLFVLPFAVVAVLLAGRRNRVWPEGPMGGLVGAGGVCLLVAYLNRGPFTPCAPESVNVRLNDGGHFHCGGLDPTTWLAAGALLVVAGLLGYVVSLRTRRVTTV